MESKGPQVFFVAHLMISQVLTYTAASECCSMGHRFPLQSELLPLTQHRALRNLRAERSNEKENLGGGNSKIFDFHPYLGKIPILTHVFQTGWNHQLEMRTRKWEISAESLESLRPRTKNKHVFWIVFFSEDLSPGFQEQWRGWSLNSGSLKTINCLYQKTSWYHDIHPDVYILVFV